MTTLKPYRHYHVLRKVGRRATGGALMPVQMAKAYNFPKVGTVPTVKIGIGSLGGSFQPSDITKAFALYGLPAPVIHTIVLPGADTTPDPNGADVENILDICLAGAAWSYCTGTPADITICYGPNASGAFIAVTNALVAAGCKAISWSWGGPLTQFSSSELSQTSEAFSTAALSGATVTAASGDNSLDDGTNALTPDYPSADPNVWGVGGTSLRLNGDGTIASEAAWGDGNSADEGGGGGFATGVFTRPTWQNNAHNNPYRGCPDSSANADPNTGPIIVASGQQAIVGGTSASSPFTCGLFAVLKAVALSKGLTPPGLLGPVLYPHPEAFNDARLGSNGDPAVAGWDAATGLGSPIGTALLAVLTTGSGPTPPPPPASLKQAMDAELVKLLHQYSRNPTLVWALTIAKACVDHDHDLS